jgi:N-acetylglucosaminyldiphosphoundecaprenol N-acetyl-beta-D-mannosaminyltransferase
VVIEGITVNAFTVPLLHQYIDEALSAGTRAKIYHANVHGMNLARDDRQYRDELMSANAIFCDGEGVRLAARLLGHRLPQRVTYADWFWKLAAHCGERGWSLFFLGGRPGVAARAAERLRAHAPSVRIVGTQHGYWAAEGRTDAEVVEEINASGAHILVVGLGMPLQESWLGRCWPNLSAGVGLTGGACFDFVSGDVPRCPAWMRRWGLEWLHRLWREPRRMFRRYVLGNPRFISRILAQRLLKGTWQ